MQTVANIKLSKSCSNIPLRDQDVVECQPCGCRYNFIFHHLKISAHSTFNAIYLFESLNIFLGLCGVPIAWADGLLLDKILNILKCG